MKRVICLVLSLLLILALSGCGDKSDEVADDSDIKNTWEEGIDVDLSKLSGTVVYSQVYNMIIEPDKYMDKIIKIKGTFTIFNMENDDNTYFACIIEDATGCCQQGFQFVLAEDRSYPENYPEVGSEITIQGAFTLYDIGPAKCAGLKDAVILE